jgi:hypothetical protein
LRASSTERSASTFAPEAAISSISSYETNGSLRAPGTIRGSAVKTPGTSEWISHAAPSVAASATAVRSPAPRPSVVMSIVSREKPWKPATSTIFPCSSDVRIRSPRISRIFARVCAESVRMPACEPVYETASSPRSSIAIATRAQAMRSPVERSMSSSRGFGVGETSEASASSWSVVFPIAETVPTTFSPRRFASTNRCAT